MLAAKFRVGKAGESLSAESFQWREQGGRMGAAGMCGISGALFFAGGRNETSRLPARHSGGSASHSFFQAWKSWPKENKQHQHRPTTTTKRIPAVDKDKFQAGTHRTLLLLPRCWLKGRVDGELKLRSTGWRHVADDGSGENRLMLEPCPDLGPFFALGPDSEQLERGRARTREKDARGVE